MTEDELKQIKASFEQLAPGAAERSLSHQRQLFAKGAADVRDAVRRRCISDSHG